jgi:hypothetical protein
VYYARRGYLISRRPLGARRCAGAAGAGAVHTLACPEVGAQKTASARRVATNHVPAFGLPGGAGAPTISGRRVGGAETRS